MNLNLQQLMKEAQKIKAEMDTTTRAIEQTTFEGSNGPVKVTGTGNMEITKIECSDKSAAEDMDAFLDMVQLAVNDMLAKIQAVKKEKLNKFANGAENLF